MYESLLPLGSVVLLKGGRKRLMIMSRIIAPGTRDAIYDYAGCFYPEGVTDPNQLFFFNRDSIERVYFLGFQDEEELSFRSEVLGTLGELYISEDGEIVERESEERAETVAPEAPEEPEELEIAHFAEVED